MSNAGGSSNGGSSANGDTVRVQYTVKNEGAKRSAVTVQCYFKPPVAPRGIMRFPRRLVAFEKVWVDGGASTTSTVSFDKAEGFGRWDDKSNGFVVDPGTYTLYVADCNINGVLDDARGCVQASVEYIV